MLSSLKAALRKSFDATFQNWFTSRLRRKSFYSWENQAISYARVSRPRRLRPSPRRLTSFPLLLVARGPDAWNAIVSLLQSEPEEMPFHFNSSLLGPGSIIRPGNWGRIVRLKGSQHPEWARECILERIRQTEFSHLPSRFDCVFLFGSFTEAEFYKASPGANALLVMYEVELTNPDVRQHEADWKGTGPYDGDEWARRYWRGDIMADRGPGPLCREVLAVTSLRVLREVP